MKSFPCWFFDYDNDGWLELFVTGYSIRDAGDIAADYLGIPTQAERARLYHNHRVGTFADVTERNGLAQVLHATTREVRLRTFAWPTSSATSHQPHGMAAPTH